MGIENIMVDVSGYIVVTLVLLTAVYAFRRHLLFIIDLM